jgi:hypothetical protein
MTKERKDMQYSQAWFSEGGAVACPTCDAPAGSTCVTVRGTHADSCHMDRLMLARGYRVSGMARKRFETLRSRLPGTAS